MKKPVVALFMLVASSGFAQQQFTAEVKDKPDAPITILESHCIPSTPSRCHATIKFSTSNETWNGYSLLWTVTFEDGSQAVVRHTVDRTASPTGLTKDFYKPGEVRDADANFGKKNAQHKELHPTKATVEVEFAVNTTGTVWGDAASSAYKEMVSQRKTAAAASTNR